MRCNSDLRMENTQNILYHMFRNCKQMNKKANVTALFTIRTYKLRTYIPFIHECDTIHQQLGKSRHQQANRRMDEASQFASWINKGKIHSALDMLKEGHSSGILHLDDRIGDKNVLDILRDKRPPAAGLQPGAVLDGTPPSAPHPVQFEALTCQVIRPVALHTTRAASQSGVDADSW